VDKRITISTSSPWESIVGYSRAVRIGNYVSVSGTTSIDIMTGEIVGEGNAYMQTVKIIENIEYALLKARATLNDVTRTRIYVLNIDDDWRKIGKAHSKFFASIRPATTMVQVSRLIDPKMLVEMEADAIIMNT
jgi:enamine deaminase RidA (YjgF/YER057c/UK114 family)